MIMIEDTEPPALSCPDTFTGQCESDIPAPYASYQEFAGDGGDSDDNCAVDENSFMLLRGTDTGPGTCPRIMKRVYKIADECGNTTSCTHMIMIEDTEAPGIEDCDAVYFYDCNPSAEQIDPTSYISLAFDNCNGFFDVTGTFLYTSNVGCDYKVVGEYRATDDCGNTTSCTFSIYYTVDEDAPTLDCAVQPIDLGCNPEEDCEDPVTTSTDGSSLPLEVLPNDTVELDFNVAGVPAGQGILDISLDLDIDHTFAGDLHLALVTPSGQEISLFEGPCGPANISSANTLSFADCGSPDVNCTDPLPAQLLAPAQPFGVLTFANSSDANGTWTLKAHDEVDDGGVDGTIIGATLNIVTRDCPTNPSEIAWSDNCGVGGETSGSLRGWIDRTDVDGCVYTQVNAYRISDDCGNTTSCTEYFVYVVDEVEPAIDCPSDQELGCNPTAQELMPETVAWADNCGVEGEVTGTVMGTVLRTDEAGCLRRQVNEYFVEDDCGNTYSCTQYILYTEDTTPPEFTQCPPDYEVSCMEEVLPPNPQDAVVGDNCGVLSVLFDRQTMSGECPTIVKRVYIATDICGNTMSCTQMITINDQTPPTIDCPADITFGIQCMDEVPPPDPNQVSAFDNCLGPDPLVDQANNSMRNPIPGGPVDVVHLEDRIRDQECPNRKLIVRVYKATDMCENMATCTQYIYVYDYTPPVISCPARVEVDCFDDVPDPDHTLVTVLDDNCDDTPTITWVMDNVVQNNVCVNQKIILRSYKATDDCGNTSYCTQEISVYDNIPPTMTCPDDMDLECDQTLPEPDPNSVTASDNCGGVVVTWVDDETRPGDCPGMYTVVRTYKATDDCFNEEYCTQHFNFDDTTPPSMTCPDNVEGECEEEIPPVADTFDDFNEQGGSADDNCGLNEQSFDLISVSDEGTCPRVIKRVYRIEDECGNSMSCTQMITINDVTPPSLTCPPMVTGQCESEIPPPFGSYQEFAGAGGNADDNCGIDELSFMLLRGTDTGPGTCPRIMKRVYKIADDCGNTMSCTHMIMIEDTEDPFIPDCEEGGIGPINIGCNPEDFQLDPGNFGVVAFDNCAGEVFVTATLVRTDNEGCDYRQVNQFRYEDDCGNATSCTFYILYTIDTERPVLSCNEEVVDFGCNPFDDCSSSATAHAATGLPAAVPSGGGTFGQTVVDIPVAGIPGGQQFVDVVLDMSLDHTFSGDLEINLEAPDGQQVKVFDNACGATDFSSANTVTFADGAGALVCGGPIPAQTAAPFSPLSTFAFASSGALNGTWKLIIR